MQKAYLSKRQKVELKEETQAINVVKSKAFD